MDWPCDDQPIWLRTRAGPLMSVPYPLEINDSPMMLVRHHTAVDFEQMIVDQFDEMLAAVGAPRRWSAASRCTRWSWASRTGCAHCGAR